MKPGGPSLTGSLCPGVCSFRRRTPRRATSAQPSCTMRSHLLTCACIHAELQAACTYQSHSRSWGGDVIVVIQCEVRHGASRCKFFGFWPSCPNVMPTNPSQSDKRKLMILHYNAHALDCVATATASSRPAEAVSGSPSLWVATNLVGITSLQTVYPCSAMRRECAGYLAGAPCDSCWCALHIWCWCASDNRTRWEHYRT